MLQITIIGHELYDETTNEFLTPKTQTLQLEHSLVSISKWESKWHKPFLDKKKKTREQSLDYIRCMTITQNVDPAIYRCIDQRMMAKINAYIDDPMTATWFSDQNRRVSNETVTSELLYYYMIKLGIPFECQKWPLGRLFTLIKICSIKNQPPKKMSKAEVMRRNRSLNAARRARSGSKG